MKELSKIYDGTHQTPNYKKSGIRFVSVEDISDLYKSNKFITKEAYLSEFKNKPEINDILMTRIGDIGTPTIVSKEEPLAYYVSLALIKPLDINPLFLKYLIESKSFQHELWKKTIHVAFPKKINKEEIGECICTIPTKDEQVKIGNILNKIDERIATQNKIIEHYGSLIKSLRDTILYKNKWKWIKLKALVDNKSILLQRGNIIPKHIYDSKFIYPVYSSSVHNDGLMGFYDSYMFDDQWITWSIDGCVNFFLRNKHKLYVTNVCGILKILDNSFDYSFLYEILSYQHSKMTFDYQTKAHPSVIQTTYSIPLLELKEQQKISSIFAPLYEKIKIERNILEHYKLQKEYLLKNLFI